MRVRVPVTSALVLAAALALGACSSASSSAGSSTSSPAGSTASASATAESATVAYAKQQVAAYEKGTEGALPSSGPIPVKGTDVWVISCGQAAIGCSLPTSAMMTAGRLIGWKMHLYDGQLNPALWGRGIQDAIAAGAKGIITYGIDCPAVKQALVDAKDAKVPVFDDEGFDCSYPGAGGGQPLFGAVMEYTPKYPTLQAFRGAAGAAQADWLIANAGQNAQILEFKDTQILTNLAVNQGFEQEIKTHCAGCTLDPIDFTVGDLQNGQLKVKTQDALLKYPNATGAMSATDSDLALVIGPLLDSAQNFSSLHIIGGEGFAANITSAGAGRWEDAGTGIPDTWEGWASVDGLNRLMQGKPQVFSGIGFRIWSVNPAVNLPPAGQNYAPAANFEANYERIWHVTS